MKLLTDLVLIEKTLQIIPVLIANEVIVGPHVVIRFQEDGAVQSGEGLVPRLDFPVPYLPGMTDLVVERAQVTVRGRRIDQPPIAAAKSQSSPTLSLNGRAGGLRRLELKGLKVQPNAQPDLQLSASSGSPSTYRWTKDGDQVNFSTSGGGKHLHLMVQGPEGTGFGPPQRAVPYYDMPNNASHMYGPVLSGAHLVLDSPSSGAARVDLSPPVDFPKVQLFMGTNDKLLPHEGLPHEAIPVNWTATEVIGIWASAPIDVELTAAAGGAETVPVSSFPGELGSSPSEVDFTPGARALLTGAYDASQGEDLMLSVSATSAGAGELVATSMQLAAHYRFESVTGDGLEVSLRGGLETVKLPVAPGLTPAQLVVTFDGLIGPNMKIATSSDDVPGRRSGLRLIGAMRGARRLALNTSERGRPLVRISVYGRADEPAELIIGLCADQNGRMGPPLGSTVALQIPASVEPGWHRVDLPEQPPAVSDGVWVGAWATTGRFWWFSDPGDTGNGPGMSSDDGGGTWTTIPSNPVVQVHYLTDGPKPVPIRLIGPEGPLCEDILQLPAARSIEETTLLDALNRGLADTQTETAEGTGATSVTFRREQTQPLGDLGMLAGLEGELTLTFDCDRDADFRVLDATLTYNPWAATS